MNPADVLASFGEQQVAGFILVLARITPLFILAPLFSSRLVPMRARSVIAVALAVGIAPIAVHAGDGGRIPLDALSFSGLLFKEILVGLSFSFAVGVLFAALASAGAMVDMLVGFSFGSLVDPLTGNQGGVLNQVYSMVGLLIFVVTNGDAWVIEGFARTYDAVPLVDAPELTSIVHGAQIAFSGIFGAAVQICAPVILAMILTDVAFGLVAKMMPQLNVFAVGFPTKVLVGVLVVGTSLPLVGNWMGDELQQSVATALRTLRVG